MREQLLLRDRVSSHRLSSHRQTHWSRAVTDSSLSDRLISHARTACDLWLRSQAVQSQVQDLGPITYSCKPWKMQSPKGVPGLVPVTVTGTSRSHKTCDWDKTCDCPWALHLPWLAWICDGWRGGGLGSRPKKMYGERLGDGVEYHLMSPTPRR